MRLWRISKHGGLAGTGGTFASGRWHAMPRRVLYTAEHPAVAMAEVMAQQRLSIDRIPRTLRLIAIDVAGRQRAWEPELPDGWQANAPTTQSVGNAWLDTHRALLMRVPSTLLPHSYNYVINASHAQAAAMLSESDLGPFWFDPRFLG